jgi:hypothetical protein
MPDLLMCQPFGLETQNYSFVILVKEVWDKKTGCPPDSLFLIKILSPIETILKSQSF